MCRIVDLVSHVQNYWNPVSWKPEDASFALHKQPGASPSKLRPSAAVKLPSKEENEKRRAWKEEQQKRQQLVAMRMMEGEKRAKEEAEARLEERRRKVRVRPALAQLRSCQCALQCALLRSVWLCMS